MVRRTGVAACARSSAFAAAAGDLAVRTECRSRVARCWPVRACVRPAGSLGVAAAAGVGWCGRGVGGWSAAGLVPADGLVPASGSSAGKGRVGGQDCGAAAVAL